MARWLTLLWVFLCTPAAYASTDETMCDRAAIAAAHGSDVPVDILRALTRTETGRARGGRLMPWPWTVNMEGAGHWFPTRAEALAFVEKHHKRGARSFDVGCFQINYRWHGEAFANIAAMFDPLQNAQYAASFLIELRGKHRTWRQAIGRYHSKTPKFARKYTTRFDRIHAALAPQDEEQAPLTARQTTSTVAAIAEPPKTRSAEARGMRRLAFLAPPTGAAIVTIANSGSPSSTSATQGLSLLRTTAPGSLLTPAKQLFN